MQTEVAGIHRADRSLDICIAVKTDNRTKYFLARHFHVLVDRGQYSRLPDVAFTLTTGQHFSTPSLCLLQPGAQAVGRALVDQRANIGSLIQWIANFERLHLGDQFVDKVFVRISMDINTLHRDARLPRIGKPTPGHATRGVGDVGVIMHNVAGIATQFERDKFLPGTPLQFPANGRATCEREQFDAVVFDQRIGVLGLARHNGNPARRPASFQHQFRQLKRADRGLRGRAQDDRATGGQGRRHFMCYEVKRKVERRNADHWPARHPADLGRASFVARQPIQRHDFAIDAFRFFGRDFEGKTGAFDFSARGLDWFAGFQRNCTRQLFFARHDAGANLLQHFAPLPRRHSACGGKGRYGCCDRLLDCVGSGAVDDGDQGIVVWAVHFDSITGMVMLAIDQIAIFAQLRLASAVGARRVVTRVAESLDGWCCHTGLPYPQASIA